MNLKATGFLVVLAIAVGVFVIINPFEEPEEVRTRDPWFYQVEMDDITNIEVNHLTDSVSFEKDEVGIWAFTDPKGIPPSNRRWGGITLLLSGPQTRRDLTATRTIIEDPAEYGLDDPDTIVNLGLTGDRSLQFRLGDTTTNGEQHYGEIPGFPYLFLIARSWGDVLTRLAVEPPIPIWFIKRDPASIVELNIFDGDPTVEATPAVRFKIEDGVWTARDFDDDIGRLPVDDEVWESITPLLGGPPSISVSVSLVDDRDYTPWGIKDDSQSIEIRFSGMSDNGITYIDGMLLRIGKKTPDGKSYYAKSISSLIREPVLVLDAPWVDAILGIADDIPYSKEALAEVTKPSG